MPIPEDRIKTLSEAINDTEVSVTNIQNLPVVPHLDAQTLQKKFDENVASLIRAIDDPNEGLITSIASQIQESGGGNMSSQIYANGSGEANNNTVDHAIYANTVKAVVSGTTLYIGRDAD